MNIDDPPKGVHKFTKRQSQKNMRIAKRMRKNGLSYIKIGKKLGVTPMTAKYYTEVDGGPLREYHRLYGILYRKKVRLENLIKARDTFIQSSEIIYGCGTGD